MFAILIVRTMNSKFLLLCRNKKIRIFLFFLFLQCQETLSSSKTVSISRGEQKEFNLFKSHSKLKVKYEGVDSVYDIDDSYSFLTPNVTIQCQCKCTENKAKWDEFPNNNYKCALLENSISTCTVYNTIGKGSVDCAIYYKLCCQVYFSKIGVQEMYSAFHLIKHKSVYKFTLTSDIFHDRRKPINLNVHSDVKRIFVNPNLIIELKNNDNLNLISEGWYYVRENSAEIISTSNINENQSAHLDKIGWLQSKDNVLLRIPKDELNTKLEVKVKNCLSDPPEFDWKLNAIHYARENNVLNIPPDSTIISSLYENTIRGYSINLKSKKIIMESSNPPDIKISIFSVNKSDLNIILYYCTIIIFKQRKPKLKLEILNGNGVFHVKLLSSLFTKQIYFYTEDINSAKDNRIIQIKELPVYDYTDTWVCVYQEEKQLCALPRILEADEQILNESPIQSREDSRELNFPISDQPDLPKSISTQTFSEVNTHETEFNFSNIIVIVVMIVMYPVIVIFAWNIFKRKHRKPCIDEMHKTETNEKDKDISQNVTRCPVIFEEIANQMKLEDWSPFGNQIGLTNLDLYNLVLESDIKQWTFTKRCNEMLRKFSQKFPSKVNREFLLHSLQESRASVNLESESDHQIFHEISENIQPDQWQLLGIALGFTANDLLKLQKQDKDKDAEFELTVFSMLEKWKQKCGLNKHEFIAKLVKVLNEIERKDIADRILDVTRCPVLFQEIVNEMKLEDWSPFGNQIGLTNLDLYNLVLEGDIKQWSFTKRCNEMLIKFSQKFPRKVNRKFLLLSLEESRAWAKLESEIDIISGEISNNGVKDPLTTFQEKLKNYYKTLDPPYFPWMGDFHLKYEDFVFQLNRVKENVKKPETIPLYEIFSEETDKILIEGDEGLGKTSLCLTLASDWVNSKPHMRHFQLVLVINIKELQVSIEEYMQRKMIKEANMELSGIIETYGEKTLFVLDGFNNELTTEQKKLVVELLTGKTFAKVKFILTSDTGLFERQISSKYSTPDIHLNVFNERFQIVQQTQDYYEIILFNLLLNKNSEHRIRNTNLMWSLNDEDLKHPLFLLLFGIVNSEDVSRFIYNRSQLYSKFCSFLINAEYKMSTETVLKNNSSIGKMALIGLEQNRKYFTKKELEETKNDIWTEIFYEDYPSGESQSTKYKPIHPHFLSYFSACYLWSIRNTVVFDRFMQYKGILNGRKVIFSFLCGLFEDQKIHLLIKQFKYLAFYYSLDLNILYEEFKHLKMTEESMEALESFIPVYLEIVERHDNSGFSSSQMLSDLLQTSASKEYIKFITWDPKYSFNLSQKIKLEKLELRVDRSIPQQSLDLCKSIQCEEMNLSLQYSDENLLKRNWFYLMKMIQHLNPQWISFTIINSQDKSCSLILEEIKSGELKERKLKNVSLECFIQNKDAFLSLVEIIQEKDVESVYIRIKKQPKDSSTSLSDANKSICQTDIDDLIISVSKNKGINELIFVNSSGSSFNVDFYSVTDKGKKHFELLWFNGNQLIFDENEKVEFQIDALMAFNPLTDVETLKRIFCLTNSSMIKCYFKLIHSISRKTKKFDLSKVKELDVDIDQTIFQRKRLLCLKKFSNLQMLCLEMRELINKSMQSVGEDIVHVIQSLPCLVSFEMRYIESNIPLVSVVTEKLMKCLSTESTTDGKMFSLKIFRLEINIHFIEESELDETLRDLTELLKLTVEPLKRRRLQEFCFLFHDPLEQRTDFPLSLAEIYPIREGFKIQWDLDGRINGSNRNKMLYKHSIYIYLFSVTLLK